MKEAGASDLIFSLEASLLHREVKDHRFFSRIVDAELTREDVVAFIGQYWHPIHGFPTFLARVIANAPRTSEQTIISRILWQELGEGDPARAHERLYIDTMEAAGLAPSEFIDAPMGLATGRLMDGYRRAGEEYLTGLGWLYGTEMIDLSIVVGLGRAVRKVTRQRELQWVTVHAQQEPSHVSNASDAVGRSQSEEARHTILAAAEEAWRAWSAFFTELDQRR